MRKLSLIVLAASVTSLGWGRAQMARRWTDFKAVLKEIETNNDRAAAIVAAATLEYALQLAIEAHCSPMSDEEREKLGKASLNDLIVKAETKGVIDKKASDELHLLRKIRNEFAHDMNPVSFKSEVILGYCGRLPIPDFLDGGTLEEPTEPNKKMRRRFEQMLYSQLLLLLPEWTRAAAMQRSSWVGIRMTRERPVRDEVR
jgi:uncharacterized protein YutE (UPF0331/DUF86 family)